MIHDWTRRLNIRTVVGLVITISIVILVFYLFHPFVGPIIAGFVLAYVLRPISDKIEEKVRSRGVAAALTTLMTASPILAIVLYFLNLFIKELGSLQERTLTSKGFLESVLEKFGFESARHSEITNALAPMVEKVQAELSLSGENFFLWGIKLLVLFLTTYYVLYKGFEIESYLRSLVPEQDKELFEVFWKSVDDVLRNMLYGHILVSLLVGLLAGMGFLLIGVPFPSLLGALAALLELVPLIGPWLLYLPLTVIYAAGGEVTKAIVVFFYGAIVLSIAPDFIIKPKLVGKTTKIDSFLVFMGFLAGPIAFGPMGIIYGPLIIGLGKGLLDGYKYYSSSRNHLSFVSISSDKKRGPSSPSRNEKRDM